MLTTTKTRKQHHRDWYNNKERWSRRRWKK